MMYVVTAHNRVRKVLDPDASESVARYLVVLVRALSVVRDVETDVLAVTNVAVFDDWVGASATYADCSAHCGIFWRL